MRDVPEVPDQRAEDRVVDAVELFVAERLDQLQGFAWVDPGLDLTTDVIVKVDTTTICGTDLHILKGDVPAVTPGRILGHEAVGTVWEVGDGVRRLSPGDRV